MTILDKQGSFDQNRSDPAFYIRFPTLEERRAARDKFARKCLNFSEDVRFARDCPKLFMNVSAQNNHDVGSGNATKRGNNWRKRQARLKKYYKDRVKRFRSRYKSRK